MYHVPQLEQIAHVWSGVGPDDAGRKIVREYLSELVKQADTVSVCHTSLCGQLTTYVF